MGTWRTVWGHAALQLSHVTVDNMQKAFLSSLVLNLFLVGCLIMCQGPALQAQTSTATISGTVSDSQGAMLSSTRIVVTNTETGVSTASATNANGAYTVASLPIGTYRVEAQREGFKTSIQGPL